MGRPAFRKPFAYLDYIEKNPEHYVDCKRYYKCEYCGGSVKIDEIKNGCCPNCGAPIKGRTGA